MVAQLFGEDPGKRLEEADNPRLVEAVRRATEVVAGWAPAPPPPMRLRYTSPDLSTIRESRGASG